MSWSNAAVWKWCTLDTDKDSSVSRHELFPVRAPLQVTNTMLLGMHNGYIYTYSKILPTLLVQCNAF